MSSGYGKYPLRHVALGLLMPGPKHGYGLYQDFEAYFGSIWKAGQAKFYVLLNTLAEKGHLTHTEEEQEGRPNRKVYHLAEPGREAFLAWVYAPVASMRGVRVEFLAKLRFFHLLGLPDLDRLLDAQRELLVAMRLEWEQTTHPEDPIMALVDDYRMMQAEFIIDWLDVCRSRMREEPE